jgi:hypothetical protein
MEAAYIIRALIEEVNATAEINAGFDWEGY